MNKIIIKKLKKFFLIFAFFLFLSQQQNCLGGSSEKGGGDSGKSSTTIETRRKIQHVLDFHDEVRHHRAQVEHEGCVLQAEVVLHTAAAIEALLHRTQ